MAYSTATSPGQGLGAIERLSKSPDFYTAARQRHGDSGALVPPKRNGHPPQRRNEHLRMGAVNVPKPGEEVCGDSWGRVQDGDDLTIMVADGLGHGLEARLASNEAVRAAVRRIRSCRPRRCSSAFIKPCAVRAARPWPWLESIGVAAKLTFAGVGNISGRIYAGSESLPEPGLAERNRRPSDASEFRNSVIPGPKTDCWCSIPTAFPPAPDWNPIQAWQRAIRP